MKDNDIDLFFETSAKTAFNVSWNSNLFNTFYCKECPAQFSKKKRFVIPDDFICPNDSSRKALDR